MELKLKKTNQTMYLNEISQSTSMKFSLCKRDGDTVLALHKFIKCRDYLNEAIVGQYVQHNFSTIYGFHLDYTKYEMDKDIASFVLETSSEVYNIFMGNLKYLNSLEVSFGFIPTTATDLVYKDSAYKYIYLQGDVKWFVSTLYISIYTFLIRSLGMIVCNSEFDNVDDLIKLISSKGRGNDAMYALTVASKGVKLDVLLKKYDKIVHNTNMLGLDINSEKESKYTVDVLHDYGGLQTFCTVHSMLENKKEPKYPYVLNRKYLEHYMELVK